tara:strand:+ start:23 stop:172 length:150 start_codon:yes stop_codon:yes gene_type:complete
MNGYEKMNEEKISHLIYLTEIKIHQLQQDLLYQQAQLNTLKRELKEREE